MGALENLVPIAVSPGFTILYNNSLDSWPGLVTGALTDLKPGAPPPGWNPLAVTLCLTSQWSSSTGAFARLVLV